MVETDLKGEWLILYKLIMQARQWIFTLFPATIGGAVVNLVSGQTYVVKPNDRSLRCASLTSAVIVELNPGTYVGETHYVTSLAFAGGNVVQIQCINGATMTPIGGLAVSGGTSAGPFATANGTTVTCVWSGGEWLCF